MSQDMSLGVRVSMDLRNFDSGVAGMNRKLKMVDTEFKAASAEAKRYGDSVSQLRTKMDAFTQKLDIQKQKVAHYRQEIDKLNAKQQQLRTSSETLAGKMQRLEQEYKQSAQATGKNSEQTKRLKQELDQVREKYTMQVQSLSRVNAAIEKNVVNLNRTREGEARLRNEIRQTSEQLDRQTSLLQRSTDRMQKLGHRMQEVGSTMGVSFTAGATAMGYALQKTVKTAADFESAMSRVGALSGATDAEMAKLTKTARDLGESTSFSASQAAEGMQFLAMAGFKTNDIIAAMPGLLDLAASGQMDLGRAADITSNIMSGFGIAATDAGRVADVLAKASSSANTDVSQLGEAMVYLAPVSKNLGWSMEEATAAVMAMSDAGIQGAQAGAAFSTSMGRLAKPTGEAKDIIEKLNIKLFDQHGTMKSMPGVVGELEKATKGMTDQQKSATLTTIFGAEAYKHWAVLIDKSSDALEKNTEMLKNSAGTAGEIAAKQMDNLNGKLKIIESSLEAASITIGNALIPIIDKLASGVQGAVIWFNNLDEGTQQMIATGAALTVGLLGVVGALGLITAALGTLLANPIVLAVVAATGAVAGLSIAVMKFRNDAKKADEDARNFGEGVSEGTKKAASEYVKLRDSALGSLNDLAFSTGEKAKEAVQNAHTEFSKLTDEAIKALEKDKAKFSTFMGKFFGDAADEGTKKLGERISSAANEYYAQQEEAIRNADKTMHELINKYGNNLFDMSEKDFQRYTAMWQTFDKSTGASVSKSVSELKKVNDAFNKIDKGVSLEEAKKHVVDLTNSTTKSLEQISKARDKDVERAKKYAKQIGIQGEEEVAFINKVKGTYAEQEVAVRENYDTKMNRIRDVLGAKQSELDFEGQMTQAEKDRFDAFLAGTGSVSSGFEDLYDKNNKFFDKSRENVNKSVSDLAKYEESVKRYGEALPESLNKFYDTLQSGGEKAKIATELIAVEMENGVKAIDLGPAGKVKVDEFVSGIQSGTYSVNDISIATINQIRTVLGQQSLTQEGIDAMNSYVNGLRETDSVQEIAKNLKVDLQSEVEIDLGPYGKHTGQSFVEGLKDGTLGIDAVYMYFQDELKKVTQVDLNEEGRQTIATLENGIQNGFLDVNQVLQQFKLDIKSDVKVDVKDEGQFTVQTLAEGLNSGQIDVDTAIKAIKGLVEQGATVDLTEKGKDTTNSYADTLKLGESPIREATQNLSNATEEELNKTDGVTPADKVGNDFSGTLGAKSEQVQGVSLQLAGITTESLNTADGVTPANNLSNQFTSTLFSNVGQSQNAGQALGDGANMGMSTIDGTSQGAKGADAFTNAVLARSGASQTAGQSNATNANSGFATIDGTSQGAKGADAFTNAVLARTGVSQTTGKSNATNANIGFATIDGKTQGAKGVDAFTNAVLARTGVSQTAGKNNATNANSGFNTINGRDPGIKGGTDFTRGVLSQAGNSQSSGTQVAKSGKGGLESVKTNSAGMNFISGFITGMNNNEGPLVSAARGLGNMALGAMKRALDIRSPSRRARDEVGEMVGEGVIIGQENKIPELKKVAQKMADASIPAVNPNDLSRATQYLHGSFNSYPDYTSDLNGSLGRSRDEYSNNGNVIVNLPSIIVEANGEAIARASYQHVTKLQDRKEQRNLAFTR